MASRCWIVAILCSLAVAAPVSAAPGDLDVTFGTGGSFSDAGDGFPRLAVQTDGRPIAAYGGPIGLTRVVRLTFDGAPDPTWGAGGSVDTDIAPGFEQVNGVAIQADGRVLVLVTTPSGLHLARFTTDGVLDTSFGSAGRLATGLGGGSEGHRLALQSDGKILVGGAFGGDLAIARYQPNGTPDASWGGVGVATLALSGAVTALTVQTDGKVLGAADVAQDTTVVRFLSSGVPDPTFGTSGSTTFEIGGPEPDLPTTIQLQADGKIVIAVSSGDPLPSFGQGQAYVVRLLPGGPFDPSWAGTGVVEVTGTAGFHSQANGLVLLGNQKVLVGGLDFGGAALLTTFIAAFDEPGTPDPTWGSGGIVVETYGISGAGAAGSDLVLQGHGVLTGGGGLALDNTLFSYVGRHEIGEFCGDGVIQPGEDCDDGSVVPGDCCSPTCTLEPSGAACADDGNSCSDDLCDGAGTCTHPSLGDGTPCDDGSACTSGEACLSGTCSGGIPGGAGCANPLVCYKSGGTKGAPKFQKVLGISLVDLLETGNYDAKVPFELCVPAIVNGIPVENPEIRQVAYKIKSSPGEPKHVKQTNIVVEDALGVHTFDTKKPELLLVPTGLELGVPAAAPGLGTALHYKCYKVSQTKGSPKFTKAKVTAADEFEDRFYDVFSPRRLCYAVDKNGEGALDPNALLTCYRLRRAAGQLPHDRVKDLIHTANQFGSLRLDTKNERDLCLPAALVP